MIDILPQPTGRLDRSRAITLLDPTVERRSRRWGAQPVGEEGADASEAASAARPAAALSNGSRQERFRRDGGSQSEPDWPRISEASPPVGAAPRPSPGPAILGPASLGEVPGSESRMPETANAPKTLAVAARPGSRGPRNEPEVEEPEPPARPPSALQSQPRQQKGQTPPPLRMAGFPEACVEQPLVTGRLPAGAAEAGFPKALPGSDLGDNRKGAAGRVGSLPRQDTLADAAGALTTPVRILGKPCPRYPEGAVRRGLQGDVLLDVEFRYSGAVEVLGVRRGLGHGLNEGAIEAARKMRFVPARREGRPVDTPATLRIRFQLLQ